MSTACLECRVHACGHLADELERHPSAEEWLMLRALAFELASLGSAGQLSCLAFRGFSVRLIRASEQHQAMLLISNQRCVRREDAKNRHRIGKRLVSDSHLMDLGV